MTSARLQGLDAYLNDGHFPATREELINQLLANHARGEMIALFERLPHDSYDSMQALTTDLDEISTLDISEIKGSTYEELLDVVVRNIGDVDHATKATYLAVVYSVMDVVRNQTSVPEDQLKVLQQRLEGGFADLRKPMSRTYDYDAPKDPRYDLPGENR